LWRGITALIFGHELALIKQPRRWFVSTGFAASLGQSARDRQFANRNNARCMLNEQDADNLLTPRS
jgi:hypothetical protein